MPQYFFRIAFKGTNYHGWQIQSNARTVQGEVDRVLRNLFGLDTVHTLGCGRTDKGVHAENFYFSFWTDEAFDREGLRYRMNNFLPPDIAVHSLHRVADDAHVRFDPIKRAYVYRIHRYKDPFLQDRSYYLHRSLDENAMQEASAYLCKCSQFGAFAKTGGGQGSDTCRVDRAEWDFQDGKAVFRIAADRFLRGMVRGIVGTMIELGSARYGMERFKEIVASRDRTLAGRNAPAQGLYLEEVSYPYSLVS